MYQTVIHPAAICTRHSCDDKEDIEIVLGIHYDVVNQTSVLVKLHPWCLLYVALAEKGVSDYEIMVQILVQENNSI